MSHPEYQYLSLLRNLLTDGVYREGRNGGTYGLFGHQMRFDLSEGFPLLTTKRIHIKSVVGELLWFLSGSTNVKPLQEQGIRIWDEWASPEGELGPVYGSQWRSWPHIERYRTPEDAACLFDRYPRGGFIPDKVPPPVPSGYFHTEIDQITNLIQNLKTDPYSRRHVVTAWNPAQIEDMALPPCHCLFQFYVADGKLSCRLDQRSGDVFLGIPFNIASYALLTHLVAREVGLQVGDFIHQLGDVHLYANHVEQAKLQLTREPGVLPQLHIETNASLFELRTEDIQFRHYHPQATIKAEVSV